jgi:hypothetical protein
MPRKQKTIHYLYKTTCLITNRFYIGIHSTDDLEDGYLGSGKRLRYSIRKHGKENHVKEILEFFDYREDTQLREYEVVNSDLVTQPNCMNLVIGGGGFMLDDYHYECSKRGGDIHANRLKVDLEYSEKHKEWASKNGKKLYENGIFAPADWTNKKHSEESKQKMSEAKKGKRTGKDSSQFGTMWITNGTENKKVKKEDLIPDGWYKGRV